MSIRFDSGSEGGRQLRILMVGRTPYHFVYYASIISALCRQGHIVNYLVDERWSKDQSDAGYQEAKKKFPNHLYYDTYQKAGKRQKYVFEIRNLMTVASYLGRKKQSRFYLERWTSYLPPFWKIRLKNRFWRWMIRVLAKIRVLHLIEYLLLDTRPEQQIIRQYNPDFLLVCPGNMRFGNEINFVPAARRLKVKSGLIVYSWDNLTTKGLIHYAPDMVFCWNRQHLLEAKSIHKINEKKLVLSGSPFFDRVFTGRDNHANNSKSNNALGSVFPNQNPYIVYLGSSANIAKNESDVVDKVVNEAFRHGFNVLIRPHPANTKPFAKFADTERLIVNPRDGSLPENLEDQGNLNRMLGGAALAIGLNTSAQIDAIALGVPTAIFEEPKYARTQKQAVHFRALRASNACYLVSGQSSLAEILLMLKAQEDPKRDVREKFVKDFLCPVAERGGAGLFVSTKIYKAVYSD